LHPNPPETVDPKEIAMKFADETYNLRIDLDTEHCELSPAEIADLERGLEPLRAPVEKFPISDLHITIRFHPRSHAYRVKLSLVLPGRTLTTGDLRENMYAAFERCVRKLVSNLLAYEESLASQDARAKHAQGTRHDVIPNQEPDTAQLQDAIQSNDYAAFRRALYVYEESLWSRVGRWLQRYPELNARLGRDFQLADVVEEVFLNAFEQFDERPAQVPLGDWLEKLIDPSLRMLAHAPDEELENINFVRAERAARAGT
jgi:ribosome-associated translation inhibitor RaiA